MEWWIPLLIFGARLCDVPIGTVRMIFVISGSKKTAAVLGFFEVIIWALAVGGVIKFLTEPVALIAYGAGFSCGTLIGMAVEEKIAVGMRMVRVINPKGDVSVARSLREGGYKVTGIEGEGQRGPVEIAFFAVKRRQLPEVLRIVERIAPDSFVTIERADRAASATVPMDRQVARRSLGKMMGMRK